MSLINILNGNWKKVAVIDGIGDAAEVELYLEEVNGDRIRDVPWPDDWPDRVNQGFLEGHGYEVIMA